MRWIGSSATVVRPETKADGTPHVVAGECSPCHFNTVSFKGATDLPSNHIPLPAADNNTCVLCHANPNDYSVSVMNHVNIASNCKNGRAHGWTLATLEPPNPNYPPTNHITSPSTHLETTLQEY